MRASNKWMLVIIILAFPMMACGLGGLLPSEEEREALVEEAAKTVEEVAAEVVEKGEEALEEASANAEASTNAEGSPKGTKGCWKEPHIGYLR